jgi:hypothetical protein
MVRTMGLFQGLVAFPVMLVMGAGVFYQLFSYYYVYLYNFMLVETISSRPYA